MGFILSIAYSLFQLTRMGSAVSNREAWTSREIAAPLEFAERVLSQQIRFDHESPGISEWRCAFYTQRGGGGDQQRYVIEVPADPDDHRLLVTVDHGGGGAVPEEWSAANHNRAAGQKLFEYLDADGQPIDSMADVSKARAVVVTIVAEHEGRRFSDSRTVFFRNR